ncbi:MAG: twin transmembrane helix small protein [Oleiphilaceae bacterium]|nr:twin transmembrane helix small protein [Oleiphilaceae bacterium]
MLIKALIVILLIAILISLFSGLVFLVKDDSKSKRVANSLAVRVSLAIVLVVLIYIGVETGELKMNPSPIPGF